MPDYSVILEGAFIVRDVSSLDDAVSIAISEAGKRLNPVAAYVEVEPANRVITMRKNAQHNLIREFFINNLLVVF